MAFFLSYAEHRFPDYARQPRSKRFSRGAVLPGIFPPPAKRLSAQERDRINEIYEWPVSSNKALLLPAVVGEKVSPLDLCISHLGPNLVTAIAGSLLNKRLLFPTFGGASTVPKKGYTCRWKNLAGLGQLDVTQLCRIRQLCGDRC